MELPFPTEIVAFVLWLGQAGVAAVILSYGLERIPAFQKWQGKGKGLFVLALYLALPFVSSLLVSVLNAADPVVVASAQDALNKALFGLVAWAGSQYSHQFDPAKIERDNAISEAEWAANHPNG